MCQFVRCETGEILRPVEGQRGFIVCNVRDRGHEVLSGSGTRVAAIGSDQRPVFQLHVAVADQDIEREAANEFGDITLIGCRRDHHG